MFRMQNTDEAKMIKMKLVDYTQVINNQAI